MGRRNVTTAAEVMLWGRRIGAVSVEDGQDVAAFAYDPTFITSGIEVAPLMMPLMTSMSPAIYRFPDLARRSFHGLPGLLADALPDKFGNALIDAWLATQGRTPGSFNAVERLCYTGTRGMGALEFRPVSGPRPRLPGKVDIDALVALASEVLKARGDLHADFTPTGRHDALRSLLSIGTSAGGARAKAVIAWNPKDNDVVSGQVRAGPDYGYWLLKFDGVIDNRDKELEDPQGYGAIEYAYSLMASAAGVTMNPCRLLEENGRRHFMTQRFDRLDGGDKLHVQTLGAMAHFDFNQAGAYSYEQALLVMRRLGLPMAAIEEQYRRAAFNIVARNQDDHVKNIAFLMDRRGQWSLSPAYDVNYSYNPAGAWTHQHQMAMNGKRDGFTRADFKAFGDTALMKRGRADTILNEVTTAVRRWTDFAEQAGVGGQWQETIYDNLRTDL